MSDNNELDNLRHSLAHLLAAAVKDLYPGSHNSIGPAVDNGFYQDFEMSKTIGDNDLPSIEKRMKEMIRDWNSFDGKKATKEEALEVFKDNPYKLALIKDIVERGEEITIYTSGNFVDLCRGGHTNDLTEIDPDSFELERTAGAYWKNDENNTMLTRIYGLAFDTKEDLKEFKEKREAAKARDHRKIGKELGLFTFSELVGAGLPLFTPKGTALRDAIVNKIKEIQSAYGFQDVTIPHITKPDLYKTSGHWDKFGDELFKVSSREHEFVMKPMNCPHHTQIFDAEARSYKDLPLRFTESTMVYRDEQTGELLGLSRVRSITQDDGHTFCTKDQIPNEISILTKVIKEFYTLLGMFEKGQYRVTLSVRDPKTPEKYLGDDAVWELAEKGLLEAAKKEGLTPEREEGEAAFYGPKLDFKFKDAIGREWQLATIQLDFNMPERFKLTYTDKDGSKQTPAMIHRAVAGSLERFLSVIIEHFNGNFPLWLAPVQVKILPVKESHEEKAQEVASHLRKNGLRVELDITNDGFGKKVKKAKQEKVPYFIIIGDKDIEAGTVTLESRDEGQIGSKKLEELPELLK